MQQCSHGDVGLKTEEENDKKRILQRLREKNEENCILLWSDVYEGLTAEFIIYKQFSEFLCHFCLLSYYV